MSPLDIIIGKKRIRAMSLLWWLILGVEAIAVIAVFYLLCCFSLGLGVEIYRLFH